jgi:hypothetical protein
MYPWSNEYRAFELPLVIKHDQGHKPPKYLLDIDILQ